MRYFSFYFRLQIALLATLCASQTGRADSYVWQNGNFPVPNGTWEDGVGTWSDNGNPNQLWNNAGNNEAVFYYGISMNSNPPVGVTVDVEGNVITSDLNFYPNFNSFLFNGPGTITTTGVVIIQQGSFNTATPASVTINNNINVDTAANSDRFYISENTAGTIDVEGQITLVASAPSSIGYRGFNIANVSGATTTLNGLSPGTSGKEVSLGLSGADVTSTVVLKGDYSQVGNATPSAGAADFLDIGQGTAVLDTSLTGTRPITFFGNYNSANNTDIQSGVLEIQGSQTLNNSTIVVNGGTSGNVDIDQSTADNSTINSGIFPTSGTAAQITFTVAAGGRITQNGGLGGEMPPGFAKDGAGTLVLNAIGVYSTDTYVPNAPPIHNPLLFEVKGGTLIDNAGTTNRDNGFPMTSAFGSSAGTVQLDSNARFGGVGTLLSTQQVNAADSSVHIAPGDPGDAKFGIAPTTGQLNLEGGLTALNGLTMDFKLTSNLIGTDIIFMGQGALSLQGIVNVNITAIDGSLATGDGNAYTLIYGNTDDDWSGSIDSNGDAPTFNFNLPAGYALDPNYGTNGYMFNAYSGFPSFSVQFVATPEPPAFFLVFGGLLLLGICTRRRLLQS